MATEKYSRYSGMTVNERLFEAGIFTEFERAAYSRDIVNVKRLLSQVDLSEEAIVQTIEWLYTSPNSIYRK